MVGWSLEVEDGHHVPGEATQDASPKAVFVAVSEELPSQPRHVGRKQKEHVTVCDGERCCEANRLPMPLLSQVDVMMP